MDVKNNILQNQGWHTDAASRMEADALNTGLKARSTWFRKDNSSANDWREEGLTLTGRLMHELMGVDKCMPPGNSLIFLE
jgi:hypothetical protein